MQRFMMPVLVFLIWLTSRGVVLPALSKMSFLSRLAEVFLSCFLKS